MDASADTARLRRQRNLLGVAAVVIVILMIAISLPRAVQRRAQLKAANAELLQLQAQIVADQRRIVKVQADIRQMQDQIGALESTR